MTRKEARKILRGLVGSDNSLYSYRAKWNYLCWFVDDDRITLDGRYTAEQLEALAWWIKNNTTNPRVFE